MNNVQLLGNMTRDPEVRHLQSGSAVTEFAVAVNEKWKDKTTGELREKVGFFDCFTWGRTGENIAKYFRKGSKILVEGKLEQDTWTDKESGAKRSKVRVNVSRFHFVGGKGTENDARQSLSGEDDQSQPAWLDPDEGRAVPF